MPPSPHLEESILDQLAEPALRMRRKRHPLCDSRLRPYANLPPQVHAPGGRAVTHLAAACREGDLEFDLMRSERRDDYGLRSRLKNQSHLSSGVECSSGAIIHVQPHRCKRLLSAHPFWRFRHAIA